MTRLPFHTGDRVVVTDGTMHDGVLIKNGEEYLVRHIEHGNPNAHRVYIDAPNKDGVAVRQWFYSRRFAPVNCVRDQRQYVEQPTQARDHFTGEPLSPIGALDNKPAANPKQAYGDKKPPVHLIHGIALLAESQALHAGRRKYGENNFIQAPVEAMTYVAGMKRHIDQWVSGEEFDPVELVSHLGAVRAGAGILLTAAACGMMIDNRPVVGNSGLGVSPKVSYKEAYNAAFERAQVVIEHLNKLYPAKLV